jgi:hypothetical protein
MLCAFGGVSMTCVAGVRTTPSSPIGELAISEPW